MPVPITPHDEVMAIVVIAAGAAAVCLVIFALVIRHFWR